MLNLPDGAVAVFLDANGNPVSEKAAVQVKVLYPDGRIVFGRPVDVSGRGRKSRTNHPRNTRQHEQRGRNGE